MADNMLLPYSASLFNPVSSWNGAGDQSDLKLSYPSWMTDATARGIGNAFTPDYASPTSTATDVVAPPVAAAPSLAVPYVAPPVVMGGFEGPNQTGEPGAAPSDASTSSPLGDIKGLASGLADAASNLTGIGGGVSDSASQAAADASAATGPGGAGAANGASGGGPTGADESGATSNFKGGVLKQNMLMGPNPKGPDTGFASVESGEGVLTREALKHYGPGIVARLNKLMVDKASLR